MALMRVSLQGVGATQAAGEPMRGRQSLQPEAIMARSGLGWWNLKLQKKMLPEMKPGSEWESIRSLEEWSAEEF